MGFQQVTRLAGLTGRSLRNRAGMLGRGLISPQPRVQQAAVHRLLQGGRSMARPLAYGVGGGAALGALGQMAGNAFNGDALFSGVPGATIRGGAMGAGGAAGYGAWRFGSVRGARR